MAFMPLLYLSVLIEPPYLSVPQDLAQYLAYGIPRNDYCPQQTKHEAWCNGLFSVVLWSQTSRHTGHKTQPVTLGAHTAIIQTWSIKHSIISNYLWGSSLGTHTYQLWGLNQPINLVPPYLLNGNNNMDLPLLLWGINKITYANGQVHFVILKKR